MSTPYEVNGYPHRQGAVWRATEYVNERRFCPLDDIQKAVDKYRYRHLSEIEELVVISFDQDACLRTLSFVAEIDTVVGVALREALSEHSFRFKNTVGANPLWRLLDAAGLDGALANLADPGLYEQNVVNPFFRLLNEVHGQRPWCVVGGPLRPVAEIGVNCLVLCGGGVPRGGAGFVRVVTVMVNGTVNASTYRDRRVTTQVELAFDKLLTRPDGKISDELYAPLVAMARQVTQSSAAAVYFYDGTVAPDVRLVARTADAEPGYRLRQSALPELDSYADAELAAVSFARRRMLLLPERHGRRGMRSTWQYRDSDIRYEMAVPIPAAAAGGSIPDAGVIVLCRGNDSRALEYGNYELALVRNVVLRIALLRIALMMEDAGLAISKAVKALYQADAGVDPLLRRAVSTRPPADTAARLTAARLPTDLARALPHVTPIIEFAGRLTGSHSVTFRLLVRGAVDADRDMTPTLLRAIAWPGARMDEPFGALRLDGPGVNAWVARHGRTCHLRDTEQVDALRGYEGLLGLVRVPTRRTRSELCVPVVVDGRLAATVNFEHAAANAFALMSNVALGCAAMAAQAISTVRRRNLRTVLSIGSEVQNSAHELTKLADRLHRPGRDPRDRDRLIADAGKTLDEVIPILQPRETDQASAAPIADLHATVREAARVAGITDQIWAEPERVTSDPVLVRWGHKMARQIYLALMEIFRNIAEYGSVDRVGIPEVSLRRLYLGGRSQVEIEIVHGVRSGRAVKVNELYRIPVQAADRPHIGAYQAGAIIRSLGGDVLARALPGDRLLTLISIPCEE